MYVVLFCLLCDALALTHISASPRFTVEALRPSFESPPPVRRWLLECSSVHQGGGGAVGVGSEFGHYSHSRCFSLASY